MADHSRDPCPWVTLQDFGGAFCMGVRFPFRHPFPPGPSRNLLTNPLLFLGHRRRSMARRERLPEFSLRRATDRRPDSHQSPCAGPRWEFRGLGRCVLPSFPNTINKKGKRKVRESRVLTNIGWHKVYSRHSIAPSRGSGRRRILIMPVRFTTPGSCRLVRFGRKVCD